MRYRRRRAGNKLKRKQTLFKRSRMPLNFPASLFRKIRSYRVDYMGANHASFFGSALFHSTMHTCHLNSLAGNSLYSIFYNCPILPGVSTTQHDRPDYDIAMLKNYYKDIRVLAVKLVFIVSCSTIVDMLTGHMGLVAMVAPNVTTSPGLTTTSQTYANGIDSTVATTADTMNPNIFFKWMNINTPTGANIVHVSKFNKHGQYFMKIKMFYNFMQQIEDYKNKDYGWAAITGSTGSRLITSPADVVVMESAWVRNNSFIETGPAVFRVETYSKHYTQWRHPVTSL